MRPVKCRHCGELFGVRWISPSPACNSLRREFCNGFGDAITRCPGCEHDLGHLADCQQIKLLPGRLISQLEKVDGEVACSLTVAERGRAA